MRRPFWLPRPNRRLSSSLPVVLLVAAASLASCTQDDDPEGARALWTKINADAGFRSWQRAPGFPTRKPSFTAHSREVEIFVNKEMSSALGTPVATPVTEWPVGSTIVKEGFSGDTRKIVAVMEKRADGWYWAEFDGEGESLFSGRPSVCVDCHDNRKSYSDWVYAFELPR